MSNRFKIAIEGTNPDTMGDPELQNELLGDGFNPDDDSVGDQINNAISIEEIANELEMDLSENNRVIDVADSLGDIQTIVENTPEDGQIDTNLIQTAANMAVAGTDVNAQDIVPSMESFADRKLAAEAIGEKIRSVLNSVINSAKEIGTKIGNFVKETFKSMTYLEKRVSEAREKLNAIDKKAVTEVTFRGKDFLIKDDGSVVSSFDEFKNAFNKGSNTIIKASPILVQATTNLSGSVTKFFSATAKMDLAKQSELGKELYQVVVIDTVKKFKSLGGVPINDEDSRIHTKLTTMSVPMGLGGYNFHYAIPDDIPKITDDTEKQRQAVQDLDFMVGKNIDVFFKSTRKLELVASIKQSDLVGILNTVEKNISALKLFLEKAFKQTRMLTMNTTGAYHMAASAVIKHGSRIMSLQAILVNKGMTLQTRFIRNFYISGFGLTSAGLKFVEQGIRGMS